jgi:hypothetical protein
MYFPSELTSLGMGHTTTTTIFTIIGTMGKINGKLHLAPTWKI